MPPNHCNIKDHLSQITIINIIIMKKFEISWELPKYDRDMKWANVGKIAPIDLLNAGLPQTYNLKNTHTHTHTIICVK